MSGPAGGTAQVGVPVPAETRTRGAPQRSVIAKLAREPFVLLVVALDALAVSVLLPYFVRSDTWLALVAGRRVWNDGLPRRDTLTIWSHGVTWVDQQWLGQLVLYGIHAAGGLRLLLLVHAIVLVGAFSLALTFALRSGASARSAGLVGIIALFTALPNSTVRTQAMAYLLFVAVFWLLASEVRQPSRRVFFVVPLLIVWANVHGSVVLGAGLVILWALAEILRLRRNVSVRAIALAAVAPLCVFISPYAFSLPRYYHDVLSSGAFRDVVSEWQPATLPHQWFFFALAVGAVWLAARSRDKLSLFEHLALVAMLFAGLDTVRSIVWFALVAAMVVPRALDGIWPVGTAPQRRRVNLALALVSLVVLVCAFATAAARPTSWYRRDYPPPAVQAVREATARDHSLRVFANEQYADWLLWNVPVLAGRVAFDARFELLSGDQLRSLARFRDRSTDDWQRAADGYRLLVLDTASERPAIRDLLRRTGTRTLYRDRHVAVLLRAAARGGS
jgi:hypothetical protein